jgi:hypothetical protein
LPREEDPLLVMSVAAAVAQMGSSSAVAVGGSLLVRRSLLDLLTVCCSRSKSGPPPVAAAQQQDSRHLHNPFGRTQQTQSGQERPSQTSCCQATAAVSYRDLLHRLVLSAARRLGYAASRLLLADYMRWLLYQWLVASSSDKGEGSQEQRSQLVYIDASGAGTEEGAKFSLADFPHQLLVSTGGSLRQQCQADEPTALARFLTEYSEIILPILSAVTDHRLRWHLLMRYTVDSGCQGTDRDLAAIIRRDVSSIKALEFTVFYAGMSRLGANDREDQQGGRVAGEQREEDPAYAEAMVVVRAVQEFVSRNISSVEAAQIVSVRLSDTIQAVFLLQTFERCAEWEAPLGGSCGSLLLAVLSKIAELANVSSVGLLLARCNCVEILAALRGRLLQTRLAGVHAAVLEAAALVIEHLKGVSNCCFYAALAIAKASLEHFPSELPSACAFLGALAEGVVGGRHHSNHGAISAELNPAPQAESDACECASSLFAELVVLMHAVARGPRSSEGRRVSADSGNSPGSPSLFDEDSDCASFVMGPAGSANVTAASGKIAGSHVESKARSFTASYVDSVSTLFASGREEQLDEARKSLARSASILVTFMRNNADSDRLAFCAPLPSPYLASLTQTAVGQTLVEEVASRSESRPVVERVRELLRLAKRLLAGEPLSVPHLWLQVTFICFMIWQFEMN